MSGATTGKATKPLRIYRLHLKNFMGVDELDFTPGHITHVTGKNGAGKSTIEKAIACMLGSPGELPKKAIKVGEDKATIYIDLGEVSATREWVRNKKTGEEETSIDVRRPGDVPAEGGAKLLRNLANISTFSPLRLMVAHPQEQMKAVVDAANVSVTPEFLTELLGEDFWNEERSKKWNDLLRGSAADSISAIKAVLFDERTALGRLKESKEAALKELSEQIPADFKGPDAASASSMSQLVTTINEAEEFNRKRLDAGEKLKAHTLKIKTNDAEIERMEQEIARRREENEEAALAIAEVKKEWSKGTDGEGRTIWKDPRDVSHLKAQLQALEKDSKLASKVEQRDSLTAEAQKARADWEQLERACVAIRDNAWRMLIARCEALRKFDVDIEDELLTVHSVPVDQLSTGEKIRFWVPVSIELGRFPVVSVDGAEQLDEEHMAGIEAYAQEHPEIQWIIAEVGEGDLSVWTKGEVADRAPLRVEEAAPTPQQVAIDGFAPAAAVKSSNGKHDDAFEGMD